MASFVDDTIVTMVDGRLTVWSQDGRLLSSGGSNLLHVTPRR
jgi:hypothetical protein